VESRYDFTQLRAGLLGEGEGPERMAEKESGKRGRQKEGCLLGGIHQRYGGLRHLRGKKKNVRGVGEESEHA